MQAAEQVAAEKARWRERFHAQRGQTPTADTWAASESIAARLAALPAVRRAGCVVLYWPLPGEPDLRAVADGLAARGVRVGLPRVVDRRRAAMEVHLYTGADALVAGPWGLSEPPPGAPRLLPSVADVVVAPGLGFSRAGVRLGYGGGYYDALLAGTRALRVGVAAAGALVDALPAEAHDARMDAVVTDREAVWCPRILSGPGA